jgi:hypothetical protein
MGQRLQDTAALFVALGGGWWNAQAGALRGSSHQSKILVVLRVCNPIHKAGERKHAQTRRERCGCGNWRT